MPQRTARRSENNSEYLHESSYIRKLGNHFQMDEKWKSRSSSSSSYNAFKNGINMDIVKNENRTVSIFEVRFKWLLRNELPFILKDFPLFWSIFNAIMTTCFFIPHFMAVTNGPPTFLIKVELARLDDEGDIAQVRTFVNIYLSQKPSEWFRSGRLTPSLKSGFRWCSCVNALKMKNEKLQIDLWLSSSNRCSKTPQISYFNLFGVFKCSDNWEKCGRGIQNWHMHRTTTGLATSLNSLSSTLNMNLWAQSCM